MKKILLAAATVLFSIASFAADEPVSEKALKAFEQSFGKAEGATWHDYTNYFEVTFRHNDIDTRISYDSDGAMLKTVRYYSGAHLPLFIQAGLQKKFGNKKIFGVTEMGTQSETVYYVVLEDDKRWLHVACTDTGDMYVTKKYNKA